MNTMNTMRESACQATARPRKKLLTRGSVSAFPRHGAGSNKDKAGKRRQHSSEKFYHLQRSNCIVIPAVTLSKAIRHYQLQGGPPPQLQRVLARP